MKVVLVILLLTFSSTCFSQELFPNNEPASTMPKHVLGARMFTEIYNEAGTQRNMFAARAMFGLFPKLTVMTTVTVSNHHNKLLPKDLVTHTHIGNSTIYYATNIKRGVKYPYQLNGFHAYAKFRFLSIDGQNKHFRIAAYGEWSNVNAAHDESEPNLLDDTKGFGAGLITTWLNKHLAVSLTSGLIIPGAYNGFEQSLNAGADIPTTINYGRALKYNLSFGYLLLPRKYEDYSQVNWNIYLELAGKSYEAAKIFQYNLPIEIQSKALGAGHYIDVQPGIQKIYNSNFRIDFSVCLHLVNHSYSHFYPMYMIGVQRYFYSKRK
ncbi:MAG: hypothetical protein WCI97_08875 [Bacteroidota bacterium]